MPLCTTVQMRSKIYTFLWPEILSQPKRNSAFILFSITLLANYPFNI